MFDIVSITISLPWVTWIAVHIAFALILLNSALHLVAFVIETRTRKIEWRIAEEILKEKKSKVSNTTESKLN